MWKSDIAERQKERQKYSHMRRDPLPTTSHDLQHPDWVEEDQKAGLQPNLLHGETRPVASSCYIHLPLHSELIDSTRMGDDCSQVYGDSEIHRDCTGTYQRSFSTLSAGFKSKLTSKKRGLSFLLLPVSAVYTLLMCLTPKLILFKYLDQKSSQIPL